MQVFTVFGLQRYNKNCNYAILVTQHLFHIAKITKKINQKQLA